MSGTKTVSKTDYKTTACRDTFLWNPCSNNWNTDPHGTNALLYHPQTSASVGSLVLTPWWHLRETPYFSQPVRYQGCFIFRFGSSNLKLQSLRYLFQSSFPTPLQVWPGLRYVHSEREDSIGRCLIHCNILSPAHSAASNSSKTRQGGRHEERAEGLTWPAWKQYSHGAFYMANLLFFHPSFSLVFWRPPFWGHLSEDNSISWLITQDPLRFDFSRRREGNTLCSEKSLTHLPPALLSMPFLCIGEGGGYTMGYKTSSNHLVSPAGGLTPPALSAEAWASRPPYSISCYRNKGASYYFRLA